MSPRIVVVGSSVIDLITYVIRMPDAGEAVDAPRFASGFGGKGANQAVAAARLGAEVVMVSKVGDDAFGRSTIENYREQGVDARHVTVAPGISSGVASAFIDPSGEKRIVAVRGANLRLTAEDVDRAEADIAGCDALVLQLEMPLDTAYHALALGRRHGRRVLLNPAPACPALALARLDGLSVLIPNQLTLALHTGLPAGTLAACEPAAGAVLAHGVGAVVVTLAAQGALLVTSGLARHVPAVPVEVRDTIGATDALVGALAHGLGSGMALADAVVRAVRYAALSVTRPGTQRSFATAEEFATFCAGLDAAPA